MTRTTTEDFERTLEEINLILTKLMWMEHPEHMPCQHPICETDLLELLDN